ncbi:pre-mRNA splicing factor [Toxoplasma gondii RUB]|uniref:Pre-mRNA splicing factor n=1 Tax=Toxoplasma gondii RUB TaxID=935652 RepID=A0A086LYQ5_TOXGO|nr:pre-mRNA splicing factor [Toxoplasma gondii RUB]
MLPHQLKRAVAEAEAHAAAQNGTRGGDGGGGESLPAGEADRLRQLQKDRAQLQLRKLQADAGLISKQAAVVAAAGLEWLYDEPKGQKEAQEAAREAYLLGKPLEAPSASSASASRADQVAAARGGRERQGEVQSASLFLPEGSLLRASDDTLRKLREDPLFLIKQAEITQKKIQEANPLLRQREAERRERRRLEEEEKRRRRERKRERKLQKKLKERKRRRRKEEADQEARRRSRYSSDEDSGYREERRRERYEDSRQGERRGGHEWGRLKEEPARERREGRGFFNACVRGSSFGDSRSSCRRRQGAEAPSRSSRSVSGDRGRRGEREQRGRSRRARRSSSSPDARRRDRHRRRSKHSEGSDSFSSSSSSSSSPSRSRRRSTLQPPPEEKRTVQEAPAVKKEPMLLPVKREQASASPASANEAEKATRRVYGPARPDVAAIQTEAFGVTDEIAPPAAIQEKARVLQEQREAQQKAAIAARNAAIDQAVRERREREEKAKNEGGGSRSEADQKLQQMREAGLRHEEDKARKHELLAMKETLQEQLEQKWRVKTEGGELFNSVQRQAFFSEGKTVEDFLQRRRARRRKGADEDDILATNAEQR